MFIVQIPAEEYGGWSEWKQIISKRDEIQRTFTLCFCFPQLPKNLSADTNQTLINAPQFYSAKTARGSSRYTHLTVSRCPNGRITAANNPE